MKSFKDYLIESHQTYDFKVKIAGECPEDCSAKIKEALAQFDVAECSAGNRTPIQESHFDFPDLKNAEVTVFEVSLNYPTTSPAVRAAIASKLKTPEAMIRVRNPLEEAETILNHANDKKTSDKALLEKDYDKNADGQKLAGGKFVDSFLKELGKNKKELTQYKGVNEKILAKKAPAGKSEKAGKSTSNNVSPVGSKKVTKPDAKASRG